MTATLSVSWIGLCSWQRLDVRGVHDYVLVRAHHWAPTEAFSGTGNGAPVINSPLWLTSQITAARGRRATTGAAAWRLGHTSLVIDSVR